MKPIVCNCNHRRGEHSKPLSVFRFNVGKCNKCECRKYGGNYIKSLVWYDFIYFGVMTIAITLFMFNLRVGIALYVAGYVWFILMTRSHIKDDYKECMDLPK